VHQLAVVSQAARGYNEVEESQSMYMFLVLPIDVLQQTIGNQWNLIQMAYSIPQEKRGSRFGRHFGFRCFPSLGTLFVPELERHDVRTSVEEYDP
jgi:hypothetical protein